MPMLLHDGIDREGWHRAHDGGISASSIPKAMTPAGRRQFLAEYLRGRELDGGMDERMQPYLDHGHRREDEFLSGWVEKRFGIPHNIALFGHEQDLRHRATPDGWNFETRQISEIKTSTKPLGKTITRMHRDQMTFSCWVMGAERCLYVHEQHVDFVPVGLPETRWFVPDPERMAELVKTANALLFQIEMARSMADVQG